MMYYIGADGQPKPLESVSYKLEDNICKAIDPEPGSKKLFTEEEIKNLNKSGDPIELVGERLAPKSSIMSAALSNAKVYMPISDLRYRLNIWKVEEPLIGWYCDDGQSISERCGCNELRPIRVADLAYPEKDAKRASDFLDRNQDYSIIFRILSIYRPNRCYILSRNGVMLADALKMSPSFLKKHFGFKNYDIKEFEEYKALLREALNAMSPTQLYYFEVNRRKMPYGGY